MFKRKHHLLTLDTIEDNAVQYNGRWIAVCKIQSIDVEMSSDFEKEAIMEVFQKVSTLFNHNAQIIMKRQKINFGEHIDKIKYTVSQSTVEEVKKYGERYVEYLEDISQGKLYKDLYIVVHSNKRCNYFEGSQVLNSIISQIKDILSAINMTTMVVCNNELRNLFSTPSFIKEEVDYIVYGSSFKRTYIITDYPRIAYPNWLKPILNIRTPIEITQHITPFPREHVIKNLELTIAKFESNIMNQVHHGMILSQDMQVKHDDAINLLRRLVEGKDNIFEVGFYITITTDTIEQLNYSSLELEGLMKSIGLNYRRARKQMNLAIKTIMPLCHDFIDETYTFDTQSVATILPFTAQDYTDKDGILYGSTFSSELITFDKFNMPNPNTVILGKPGFGKSTLAKLEALRHIVNGAQCLIIDHNSEYKPLCELMGGQYVEENTPIDWNRHMIVFSGKDKAHDLRRIWSHIIDSSLRERILIIDEFHHILKQDKDLLLTTMREIRKFYTAPTIITQNIREFLKTDEGKQIIDYCSVKVLLRQGETDLEEISKLFDLSKSENLFLRTSQQGHGYIITDLFKTKFKVEYSTREHHVITTNPRDKVTRW